MATGERPSPGNWGRFFEGGARHYGKPPKASQTPCSISNAVATVDDGMWPMNIFVNNNGGVQSGNTWCAMRLYSFKIYEGDALKRDFVPCVETATGRAGLYDTVEGEFHENKGSNAFVAEDAAVTLKDDKPPEGAAFYRVVVSVP